MSGQPTRWQSVRELRDNYLKRSPRGKHAAEIIAGCHRRREAESAILRHGGDPARFNQVKSETEGMIRFVAAKVLRELQALARTGEVVVWGRRDPGADHELIEPRYWPFLRLEVADNAAVGDQLSYRDLKCAMRCELSSSDLEELKKPLTPASDNVQATPEPIAPPAAPATMRTGTPGRPSAVHLAVDEFRRRRERGELMGSLEAEGQYLSDYVRRTFREAPSLTAKTVKNKIRSEYRAAKLAR